MNYPQPRTASEALRLAKTEEKAQAILSEGYTFEQEEDTKTVSICKPGKLSASYWIMDGECSCPDFQKHGNYCKHILAWGIWKETVENCKLSLHGDGSYTLEVKTKEEAEAEACGMDIELYRKYQREELIHQYGWF